MKPSNHLLASTLTAFCLILGFQNCGTAESLPGSGNLSSLSLPRLSLSLATGASISMSEGQGTMLRVSIANSQQVDLPLNIRLTPVTASASDASLPSQEVTIPAGSTSATFTVTATSDSAVEAVETVDVIVEHDNGAEPSAPVRLQIVDQSPLPHLSVAGITLQEGGQADLIIQSDRAIETDIIFNVSSSNGTAVEPADYNRVFRRDVTIPTGQTSVAVRLTAKADFTEEPSETFSVSLTNVRHAIAPVSAALVTISDQTALPTISMANSTAVEGTRLTFTVFLSAPAETPVTMRFETIDGTAVHGVNFDAVQGIATIPVGAAAATISVNGRNDGAHAPDKSLRLRLSQINGAMPSTLSATGTFVEAASCDGLQRIHFARVFQDDMVLHEKQPRIWGTARPNTDVIISLKDRPGSQVQAHADAQGRWNATIPGNPVRSGNTEVIAQNVCEEKKILRVKIGEVWLCSGQSNMSLPIERAASRTEVVAEASLPVVRDNLRFFRVANATATTPLGDFPSTPASTLTHTWLVPATSNIPHVSAVCYHFGRELQKALNKPVGLVISSYGGTFIQAWTPRSDLPSALHLPASETAQHNTGVLFNAMIAPLAGLKLSGVAWYQGETNRAQANMYQDLLKYWAASWRKRFLNTALDLHLVQLAGLGAEELVSPGQIVLPQQMLSMLGIRQAQWEAVLSDAHIGLATAIGTTSAAEAAANDIHPRDKKTVGLRLAKVALTKTYKRIDSMPQWRIGLTSSSPNKVSVAFTLPNGETPPALNTEIPGFQVSSSYGVFLYAHSAKVKSFNAANRIVTIEVASALLSDFTEVRFQFAQNPRVGYRTPVGGMPLLPLCLKKTSGVWNACNLSL